MQTLKRRGDGEEVGDLEVNKKRRIEIIRDPRRRKREEEKMQEEKVQEEKMQEEKIQEEEKVKAVQDHILGFCVFWNVHFIFEGESC